MDGSHTHTSLLLFLVTVARNQKAPKIFGLTTFCNIVIKVEAYKSQNRLMQCYNSQHFGHIWVHCSSLLTTYGVGVDIAIISIQRNRTQRVSQPAAIATCKIGNRCTKQVTEVGLMQNRNYNAQVACGDNTGVSREDFLSKYTTPD
jgi:hypothetical protein